jgi:hypothetical protein
MRPPGRRGEYAAVNRASQPVNYSGRPDANILSAGAVSFLLSPGPQADGIPSRVHMTRTAPGVRPILAATSMSRSWPSKAVCSALTQLDAAVVANQVLFLHQQTDPAQRETEKQEQNPKHDPAACANLGPPLG